MHAKLLCLLAVLVSHRTTGSLYADEDLLYGQFPDGFIWASATSAYQIEGGWAADGNHDHCHLCSFSGLFLVCSSGKGLSIWDIYTDQPGIVAEGATGQTACNSYYFYQQDVDALAKMNVQVKRAYFLIT